MRVVVLGASGQIGAAVAAELSRRGVEVVAAQRSTGVDAYRDVGLDAAFADADVVVDCLNKTTMKASAAVDFFGTSASNVARAAAAAGAAVICLTIANAADPTVNAKFGYYQGKAAQEEAYRTVLRPDSLTLVASTQWYELALQMLGTAAVGPLALVPHMRCRPAAAADVAAVIADQAERVADERAARRSETPRSDTVAPRTGERRVVVAGPQVLDLLDVAKAVAAQKGSPRWVIGIRFGGAAIRDGALVPDDPDVITDTTLERWVQTEFPQRA